MTPRPDALTPEERERFEHVQQLLQTSRNGFGKPLTWDDVEFLCAIIDRLAGLTSQQTWRPIEEAPHDEHLVANMSPGRMHWALWALRGNGSLRNCWYACPNGRSVVPTHFLDGALPSPPAGGARRDDAEDKA